MSFRRLYHCYDIFFLFFNWLKTGYGFLPSVVPATRRYRLWLWLWLRLRLGLRNRCICRLRLKLGHRLHHKPGELSGGEQQRVAMARALMQKPDVVLADEPTGNLDTHSGDGLFGLMRTLSQTRGTTFVIVTHNDKLSAQSDRIIHMQDGQIV